MSRTRSRTARASASATYLRFRLTGDLSIPRACGAQWLLVDRERLGFEPKLTPVYRDARWILYRL